MYQTGLKVLWAWLLLCFPRLVCAQFYGGTAWTNASGGNWKDPYWSGGLPQNQTAYLSNPGSKTLVFDATTYGAYTNMPDFSFKVSGDAGTTNSIIFEAPDSSMIIGLPYGFQVGLNGFFENRGAKILMSPMANNQVYGGTALFSGGACDFYFSGLFINGGSCIQTGGTNDCSSISCFWFGTYELSGGSLNCTGIIELGVSGVGGTFNQSGGSLTAASIIMPGPVPTINQGSGGFSISGGSVEVGSMSIENYCRQTGGSVVVGNLAILGPGQVTWDSGPRYASWELSAGILNSSQETLKLATFLQDGGTNITGLLSLEPGYYYGPGGDFETGYLLNAGQLIATNISLGPVSTLACGWGTNSGQIYNPGTFSLAGTLDVKNSSQKLGALFVLDKGSIVPPTINLYGSSVLKFADSSGQSWDGIAVLTVRHWSGSMLGGGSTQLIFGTNSSGLTASQLAQVRFVNPAGLPPGSYPGIMLPTGEVVPNAPVVICTNSEFGLILRWSGTFTLETSVDVQGPYSAVPSAFSPYTNALSDDHRFFRVVSLRL